ncbi:CHC2 zinc finger domain-containing protein [Xylella fastidiosa]
MVACCPVHQENTPSFHVSPQKNTYRCWGCGARGDAI